jgi:dihydrodipicolinate synthase/N-acetylneuraminate lyase
MQIKDLPRELRAAVKRGLAIPAHPLALNRRRALDERHQQALTRYYVAAGAGGIAVGVHSTQFEIREPEHSLLRPVLELASRTADEALRRRGGVLLKVAGVCGTTPQAVREAQLARELGYHACLLSLAALRQAPVAALLEHCRRVAEVMPLIGFYLQPAIGGRVLPLAFWRGFASIANVLAIKIAPFNRYLTLEVLRAVAEVGRTDELALYTGNDDTIAVDLLTPFRVGTADGVKTVRIAGGLLGHWAVWTKTAVDLLREIQAVRRGGAVPAELLTRAAQITDCNAAFFDAANGFAGCIPGIHEVLRRQGLMAGTRCLNPRETLSPGQAAEIDRVYHAYPRLNDDAFVDAHRDEWLG